MTDIEQMAREIADRLFPDNGCYDRTNGYQRDAARMAALEMAKAMQQVNDVKWVSVEKGFPTKTQSRKQWQVMRANGDQVAAFWSGKFFNIGSITLKDVTHWMPLPSPPKES